jgi:hypothetical protein
MTNCLRFFPYFQLDELAVTARAGWEPLCGSDVLSTADYGAQLRVTVHLKRRLRLTIAIMAAQTVIDPAVSFRAGAHYDVRCDNMSVVGSYRRDVGTLAFPNGIPREVASSDRVRPLGLLQGGE